MIYTHVLSRVGKGVKSPVDDLTTSIQKAYGYLRVGVLCCNFAARRCYKETIYKHSYVHLLKSISFRQLNNIHELDT